MARDPQGALIALNRFGFGARGGASGDLMNAASDPRGFVKAELARPNGALLELPGLQATPVLAEAVFAYQDEVKRAREAAAKSDASPEQPGQTRNPPATGADLPMASPSPAAPQAASLSPQAGEAAPAMQAVQAKPQP